MYRVEVKIHQAKIKTWWRMIWGAMSWCNKVGNPIKLKIEWIPKDIGKSLAESMSRSDSKGLATKTALLISCTHLYILF